jgi:hypothetical protein
MADQISKTATQQHPAEEEQFEISLRLLGNEIFAMQLMSKSKKRNWAIFGLISLVLVTILVKAMMPLLQTVSTML